MTVDSMLAARETNHWRAQALLARHAGRFDLANALEDHAQYGVHFRRGGQHEGLPERPVPLDVARLALSIASSSVVQP